MVHGRKCHDPAAHFSPSVYETSGVTLEGDISTFLLQMVQFGSAHISMFHIRMVANTDQNK